MNVLIWEYPSASLKTLCPYCDPCDSFKTISLHTKIIPTSRHALEIILQESQQLNPDPHSFHVVLINDRYGNLLNQRDVLKHIQTYPINSTPARIYLSADQHLTSLLLPKSANTTFSGRFGKYFAKWKNIIVDACSPTEAINSHPVFRPLIMRFHSRSQNLFQESRLVIWIDQYRFVSCHKEQVHWTNQHGR